MSALVRALLGLPLLGLSLQSHPARAQAPAEQPDAAMLIGLSGPAFVSLSGASPVQVDRCTGLPLGATVCTGPDSFATVRLDPSPTSSGAHDVVLMPGTCLDIEQATADRTQLRVERGSITVATPRPRGGSSTARTLAIRTRDGLAEGKDGGFRVAIEERATRTEAVTGGIRLSGDGGSLELAAGKGSRVSQGEAPTAPVDLLLSQALLSPEAGTALIRPDFHWQEVPHGTGYRIELSADATFTDIVEAMDVAEPRWLPDFLFAPQAIEGLWWRVAPYDRLGFLGIPSEARPLLLPPGVRG